MPLFGKGVDRGKSSFFSLFLHILGDGKKGFLERGRKLIVRLIVVMEIFHYLIDLILNGGGRPWDLNELCKVVRETLDVRLNILNNLAVVLNIFTEYGHSSASLFAREEKYRVDRNSFGGSHRMKNADRVRNLDLR